MFRPDELEVMRKQWVRDVTLVFDNDFGTHVGIAGMVALAQLEDDPSRILAEYLREIYEESIICSIKDDNSLGNLLIREICLGTPSWWFESIANDYLEAANS